MYVLTTIPDVDLPKPSTMFNHVIDELDKCPTLKQKVEKARESRPGSHMRITEWLWNHVDIVLECHQQKINRQGIDRTLKKGKPQVLRPNTQLPKDADPHATISYASGSSDHEREEEAEEEKIKKKEDPEVLATPAAKGKGKGGKGDTTPRRTPRWGVRAG